MRLLTLFALAATASVAGAQPDSTQIPALLCATLGVVREQWPLGRVVLDRVAIDTTKRLAPDLLSRREHRNPEDWARAHRVEAVQSELAQPVCQLGSTQCAMREDIVASIAFADPAIVGDSARVIVRTAENVGGAIAHVSITVEELTLRRSDDGWRVTGRRIRART